MAIFASVNLLEISEARRQAALGVIREVGVVEAWQSVGATVNLVGSVRSGLIMKNLDIDFHVYTDEPTTSRVHESLLSMPRREGGRRAKRSQPMLEKSRAAIARLKGVRDIQFRNLLDTEEECLEWHAAYDDAEGTTWQLDMIHIRRGSTFDGAIERTTDAIIARLEPETREAILRIKHDAPEGVKTPGIEVYYAVLSLGLRTYEEFAAWKQSNPSIDLLGWMP